MKRTFLLLLVVLTLIFQAYAKPDTIRVHIPNFTVKENLLKNEKIAIIACSPEGKPLEEVTGNFLFNINGFKQELRFNEGIAVAPQQIEKSTFIYLRHTNVRGTYGKLYYVIKSGTDLNPIKINWLFLVLIPMGIILFTMLFRKFLFIAIALILGLYFLNSGKGLTLPTIFDTIFDGLKSLI